MEKYISVLKKSIIFNGLSDEEIGATLIDLTPKKLSYEKGNFIIRNGDIIKSFGIMISGKAIVIKEDFWGNRSVISELLSGDIFAETFACLKNSTAEISVEALEKTEVMFFNVEKMVVPPILNTWIKGVPALKTLNQLCQPQDLLPAVPLGKAEQHIAADGHVQLGARVLRRQHFQCEDGIVPAALCGLLDFPAAHRHLQPGPLLGQRGKAAAHLGPEGGGRRRGVLKGRRPGGHHHHLVGGHPGGGGTEVVQVAVVGRVEGPAVKQQFHCLTSASRRRRCPFSSAGTARTWSRSPARSRRRWPPPA